MTPPRRRVTGEPARGHVVARSLTPIGGGRDPSHPVRLHRAARSPPAGHHRHRHRRGRVRRRFRPALPTGGRSAGGLRIEWRTSGLCRNPLDRSGGHRDAHRRAGSVGLHRLRHRHRRVGARWNAVPLSRAMARLEEEGRAVTAWSPSWPGDLHAGRTETSLMLAIDPSRVRLDKAEAGDLRSVHDLLPLLRQRGTAGVSANGVLGDPAGATADEGRRLLATAVDQLVDYADGLADVSTREVTGWTG